LPYSAGASRTGHQNYQADKVRPRLLNRRGRWALTRLDPAYEQAAASLGARPARVLFRVRLPLLLPSLTAAAGLCFALSMGELSATMMLYPPDWTPLPVLVYAATDRGALFTGSAAAVVLMAATLLVLFAVSRVRTRASYR
ncbi:ABC transporter permease, partial [Streptomyces olivaceoviridis]